MYTNLSSNFWTCLKLLIISLGDGSFSRVQYRAVSKARSCGEKSRNTPAGRVTAPLPDLSGEETASPQLQGLGVRHSRKQWESQRTAPLPCRHLGDWAPGELLCLPTSPGLGLGQRGNLPCRRETWGAAGVPQPLTETTLLS